MDKVKIRVFASLREALGWSEREFSVDSNTVSELLNKAIGEDVEIYDLIVKDRRYRILVNGRDIDLLEGFETEIKDGYVITIFPPIAGG